MQNENIISKKWTLKIHSTRLFGPTRLFFSSKKSSIHVYSDYTFIRNGRVNKFNTQHSTL